MAAVYLAQDLRLDRKVAIKVMLPELSGIPAMSERFKLEARTAARLSHPNIIIIHAVEEVGDLLFFVMNFVQGCSLDLVMRDLGQFPLPLIQALLPQVAHALHYAHCEGVVHRDVKPGNIMINTKGDAIVTDFGIARATEAPHLTQTGASIGTPTYMSPEQCVGLPVSGASDQYSLGIVAYELLGGVPPFTGSAIEIQWAHSRDVPRPLGALRPDCPARVADAVMRMLEKDPAKRWPTLLDAVLEVGFGALAWARERLADLARSRATAQWSGLVTTPASPLPLAPVPTAPPPVLVLSATERTIECGETTQLVVSATDHGGTGRLDLPVVWSSSDDRVAAVTAQGLVTGVGPGSAIVTARSDAQAVDCMVTVDQPRVVRLVVSPSSAVITEGGELALVAVALDARGTPLRDRPVRWESSDRNVAEVSSHGIVAARAPGQATLGAACEGWTAAVTLSVTAAAAASGPVTGAEEERAIGPAAADGATVTASSVGLDELSDDESADAPRARRRRSRWVWVGVAGAATGLALALFLMADGGPSGTAREQAGEPAAAMAVRPPPMGAEPGAATVATVDAADSVATLELTSELVSGPGGGYLSPGARVAVGARARNVAGDSLPEQALTWSSSDTTIATVSPDGEVTARAEGPVTIQATAGGRTAQLALRVARPRLVPSVSSRPITLAQGDTVWLTIGVVDESRDDQPVGRAPQVETTAQRVRVRRFARARYAVIGLAPGTDTIRVSVDSAVRRVPVLVTAGRGPVRAAPAAAVAVSAPSANVARAHASNVAQLTQYAFDAPNGRELQQRLDAGGTGDMARAFFDWARTTRPSRCTSDEPQLTPAGDGRFWMSFSVQCEWRRGVVRTERGTAALRGLLSPSGPGRWAMTALEVRRRGW
jgi:hypothetical protein